MLLTLAKVVKSTGLILLFILLFFGLICILVLLLRKKLKLNNKNKKPDENKIAEENLNRLLEDVNDPETQKQFDDYEKNKKDE